MSNFSIFSKEFASITVEGMKAEQYVYDDPTICGIYCRRNLEGWVHWLYENEPGLELPYDQGLHSLLTQPEFTDLFSPEIQNRMHLIRKAGNRGSHKGMKKLGLEEALHLLELTYGLNKYLVNLYGSQNLISEKFDREKIPPARKIAENLLKAETADLRTRLETAIELHKKSEQRLKQVEEQRLKRVEKIALPHDPNETQTRELYIDLYLEEAGWDLSKNSVKEYELAGMPNKGEMGYADYVLWGKDGLPLAVVEAKRTSVDVMTGRHQAELYAGLLEKKFGRRPAIFLSNGYEIYFYDWDTPLRKVHGFYTRDELERNIERRNSRGPIYEVKIKDEITDRYYQKAAIHAVAEHFNKKNRGALLVMATGTGKTRTAASLIDVLSRAGWIKNVLFLADRDALVVQAKNAINRYLPDFPSVDLRKNKELIGSRIVFSTYQTMINLIDGVKSQEGKFYTVGHFDLIIFDEIHRSVYNKYRAVFDYFDGYKIGLTATPKEEQIHADTYELFGLPKGNPTYSYSLSKAVEDGYLRNYKSYSVGTKFRREGIKYDELPDAEKEEYEEKFADPITGEIPDEIEASKLDSWIYNKGTADLILKELMEKGIQVENGNRLGKTIIFCRKSDHARFIRERFNVNYPQYGDQFLKVIDYQTNYSEDLIESFKGKDKMPVIASSVDMLDTGIDVPEVVNLVFLKPVKSPIKFWQMIGRGTRLCPDLFGPGKDKEEFLILDFCQNFEYFQENPNQKDSLVIRSLNERLFTVRLRISQLLIADEEGEKNTLAKKLIDHLHSQTTRLYTDGKDSFVIRPHLKTIEKFVNRSAWKNLTDPELRLLNTEIAPLVYDSDQDNRAKSFDLLVYELMLALLLEYKKQAVFIEKVKSTARQLQKKEAVPMVKMKMADLEEIAKDEFWIRPDPVKAEAVREKIRDLVKFLDNEYRSIVETDFADELTEFAESPAILETDSFDKKAYRRKVEQYLQEHKDYIVIDKLRKNKPITKGELVLLEKMLMEQGKSVTEERFHELLGEQSLGQFIRSIVGLEVNAAKVAFSVLIEDAHLNPRQIAFLDMIIDHFVENGKVTIGELFEPPFTNIDSGGLLHLFDQKESRRIGQIIEDINKNSEVI